MVANMSKKSVLTRVTAWLRRQCSDPLAENPQITRVENLNAEANARRAGGCPCGVVDCTTSASAHKCSTVRTIGGVVDS